MSSPVPSATGSTGGAVHSLEPWRLDHLENIGYALTETAGRMPEAIAVACPAAGEPSQKPATRGLKYDQITFAQLESDSNRMARGLMDAGVQPGMRLALMIPPGIDFVTHVFALFKTGAVAILIDPGMGRKNMIRCLAAAEPVGLVGIRKAQLARWVFRRQLGGCRINVSTNGWMPGCWSSESWLSAADPEVPKTSVDRESAAAIIFTTGSTGPPKGVLYRHRNFIEQSQQIRDYFGLRPGAVDVSGFPLFALFNTAMGTTTVFPQMDATRPASIHPPNLIDAAEQFAADQSFGSPALWNTVSRYCQQHRLRLDGVQRVLTAGAPVSPLVLEQVKSIIASDGEVFTPYGATEALPVACQSATSVLSETAAKTHEGAGTCVGNRFPGIEWRVIEISEQPLPSVDQTHPLPVGQIGELMVQGPVVTDQYVTRVAANAEHKVADGDGFWHRMGDVGYLDDQDRFWFCGRKAHRVQTPNGTLYTVPCEAIANTHPAIYRSALVGAGAAGEQIPVIIAEPHAADWPGNEAAAGRLVDELTARLAAHPVTESIRHVLLRRALPVDIRHNSKIFREQLKPWAEQQLTAAGQR